MYTTQATWPSCGNKYYLSEFLGKVPTTNSRLVFVNISKHLNILYYIILYRIVSYRIVSYRIVSYRIVSYRIVSYRIVSYRIVSYRIVSYHIILYYIIKIKSIVIKQQLDIAYTYNLISIFILKSRVRGVSEENVPKEPLYYLYSAPCSDGYNWGHNCNIQLPLNLPPQLIEAIANQVR